MESDSFSPQESLDLITKVLQEAKERQEENGVIYIFWGILIAIVGVVHYVIQSMGLYQWIFAAYLLIPIGVAISYLGFPRYKMRSGGNHIGKIIGVLWLFVAANLMVLGFVLAMELGKYLTPYVLILKGVALGLSGYILQYRVLLICGIMANLIGLLGFFVPWEYHPLLLSVVSLTAVLLPGILLNRAYIARKYV